MKASGRAIIRNLEKASEAKGGYLNHSERSFKTDMNLAAAIESLNLSQNEALLWTDSRCARYFMDTGNTTTEAFIENIKEWMPELLAEMENA